MFHKRSKLCYLPSSIQSGTHFERTNTSGVSCAQFSEASSLLCSSSVGYQHRSPDTSVKNVFPGLSKTLKNCYFGRKGMITPPMTSPNCVFAFVRNVRAPFRQALFGASCEWLFKLHTPFFLAVGDTVNAFRLKRETSSGVERNQC
jgi:hypothetical protein